MVLAETADATNFILRSSGEDISKAIVLFAVIILVYYVVNFIVLGSIVLKFGNLGVKKLSISLVWLTLLGQVADRLGALLAIQAAFVVATTFPAYSTRVAWAIPLVGFNFLFSGIAIGALVFFFSERYWQLSRIESVIAAFIAAIMTNPAWVVGALFISK